ncbi:probable ATP-dependent RNA helicase CG8611 [Drosophila grimshawi]|uniref:ATP-dependent RNA helicase n=1 Tax=Drosophila grimshawi TaxID=7222 RepID=B4JNW7_DROGR|nr:probable ATP-dependent RNA helicase CG8611 [Drosophila grimshawi]EDV92410.1 GH24071 [Drosophila grimshawi]
MVDNITLNICTKPLPRKATTAASTQNVLSKKQKRAAPAGFDFQFNVDKPKIKALVVRRRAKTTTTTPTMPTRPPAAPASASDLLFNASMPKNTEQQLKKTSSKEPLSDFMFNVSVPQDEEPIKPKPQSAVATASANKTKSGRERAGIISKEQLKDVIKKQGQGQNPNKQPRAGDLFKAQLDKEHRRKREETYGAAVAAPEKEAEADTEPKKSVQPVNKFRSTKKIGLFDQSDVAALKQLGQRAVKPVKETIFSGSKVESLGLHAHAVKNLKDLLSISQLTSVQQKAIPQVLAGRDVLVRSQTGSGKTLAYALPMVERLQSQLPRIKRTDGVLALIIVPTRELALQTYELFQKLVKPYTWIVPGALLGGESRKSEKARLRKGINVLLGTPGRLVDHLLHTASFRLSKLHFLVLDEADRLLELGYERDVKQLVEAIDKQRTEDIEQQKNEIEANVQINAPVAMQRLLLSATLTAQVQQLAGLTLKDPIYIDNSDEAADAALKGNNGYHKDTIEAQSNDDDGLGEYLEDVTGVLSIPENLQLSYVIVPPKLRLVTIAALFAKELAANPKQFKAIVFMSTTEMVNFHHDVLNEALTRRILDEDDEDDDQQLEKDQSRNDELNNETPLLQGLRFFKLNGSMTQTERQAVFRGFRECANCVLLATDVVGRGIDVPDVKLVVQYTPPQTTADFVHRVGRTARAGRRGRAVLFLAPSEAQYVRHLENKRIRIQQGDMYGYLEALLPRDAEARTVQEAASNLQHKFQSLLEDDRELHDKSCKAFVSWMKFYSTFPKELKPIFNVRATHMGHFAKSFALKEAPSKFASKYAAPKAAPPTNRLTYTERDPEKVQQAKRAKRRLYTTTVSGDVRQLQQHQQQPAGGADRRKNGQHHLPEGAGKSNFMKSLNKSRALTISEFDSGLESVGAPKRRKQA